MQVEWRYGCAIVGSYCACRKGEDFFRTYGVFSSKKKPGLAALVLEGLEDVDWDLLVLPRVCASRTEIIQQQESLTEASPCLRCCLMFGVKFRQEGADQLHRIASQRVAKHKKNTSTRPLTALKTSGECTCIASKEFQTITLCVYPLEQRPNIADNPCGRSREAIVMVSLGRMKGHDGKDVALPPRRNRVAP